MLCSSLRELFSNRALMSFSTLSSSLNTFSPGRIAISPSFGFHLVSQIREKVQGQLQLALKRRHSLLLVAPNTCLSYEVDVDRRHV